METVGLILIGAAVVAMNIQLWRLRRTVEEQNVEWLDYVKALGEWLRREGLRSKACGQDDPD